jgi:hypothetical protein
MGMSAGGPDLIQDGLVLCLDAGDRNSYQSGSLSWFDLSGNNNSGSLVNGPTFNTGSLGSIVFDGTNDYVQVNAVNSSYFTLSVWAKWTQFFSSNQGHSLVSNNTSTSNGYMLYQSTEFPYNRVKIFVVTTTLQALDITSLLSTNVWYNIVGTYNGSFIRLYLNGILDSSTSQTGITVSNPSSLIIGKVSYGNSYFNGDIASTQIYNRALSAQEILQNYNAYKSRFGLT